MSVTDTGLVVLPEAPLSRNLYRCMVAQSAHMPGVVVVSCKYRLVIHGDTFY